MELTKISLVELVDMLATLEPFTILNFSLTEEEDLNFGIGWHYIFEASVLCYGYWGGMTEDESGHVKTFNLAPSDLSNFKNCKGEIISALKETILFFTDKNQDYVFLKDCVYAVSTKYEDKA